MSDSQKLDVIQEQHQDFSLPTVEETLQVFSKIRVDLVDINILRAFYITGMTEPMDTTTWCFPILYKGFKDRGITRTGYMGFYKKVAKLHKAGMLIKIKRTNPVLFNPNNRLKYVIRKSLLLWLANRGLKMSDSK